MTLFVGISIAAFVVFAYAHLIGALVFETWLRRQSPALRHAATINGAAITAATINAATNTAPTNTAATTAKTSALESLPVAVLVCSRGVAPQSSLMLAELLQQDYENYQVYLVVDQSNDGNWEMLTAWKTKHDAGNRLTLLKLTQPRLTCGLKCSALLTALEQVPPTTQFVALIDCDVIPRRDWLRNLVEPLKKTEIGVITGGQWYEPTRGWGLSTMVRSLWNAGAIVPTWILANPWAGSLSIRFQDLADSQLIEQWGTSVVDDGPVRQCMNRLYRAIWFSPHLIAVNQEPCNWSFVVNYVTRMMTWSRWYESTFFRTAIHAAITMLVWVLLILAVSGSILNGQWPALAACVAALAFAALSMFTSYLFVRGAVYRAINQSPPTLPWQFFLAGPVLIVIAQAVFCWAVASALFRRRIRWRQATYIVHGPQRVRLEKYLPYQATPNRDGRSI